MLLKDILAQTLNKSRYEIYYELVSHVFLAGVGVPLMLTYVYGVVPMSLCRNGWCRSQSEPPETHKIQLEDLANCEYRRNGFTFMLRVR